MYDVYISIFMIAYVCRNMWGDMLEVFLDLFPLYLLRDQSLNPELTNLTCQAGQACPGESLSLPS